MNTAEIGQSNILKKLNSLGARNTAIHKEGNRSFITFSGPNGKCCKVTTRSKTAGTWQTTTNYAASCTFNKNDNEFWVFVDIGREPNLFYIVPLSWIRNDIHEAHSEYLRKHDGYRVVNDNSTHHSIPVKRISAWKDAWAQMGF